MNLSVVLFILIVVFIKYWLLLFTSPLLMAYCWLHRRKNMANPEGEVSEIRDSGITSSSCSKKLFKRIDKRGLINIVDGYFRWMIKIISDIPPHIVKGGISLVTTAPAAITAPSPIVTLCKIVTLGPIHTRFFI